MTVRSGIFLIIRLTLAAIYLWVVADRLSLLGPAGNPGVVWGNFETFLDYTATLNPWFPREISDVLGYLATAIEVLLAVLLIIGFRLDYASLLSFGLLMAFASSLVLAIGPVETAGFVAFTVVAAGASFALFREARRKLAVSKS